MTRDGGLIPHVKRRGGPRVETEANQRNKATQRNRAYERRSIPPQRNSGAPVQAIVQSVSGALNPPFCATISKSPHQHSSANCALIRFMHSTEWIATYLETGCSITVFGAQRETGFDSIVNRELDEVGENVCRSGFPVSPH